MDSGLKYYLKLPHQFQNVILNIKGLQLYFRRYSPQFKRYLLRFENSDTTKINYAQFKLFLDAANKVPYWHDQFKKHNMNIHSPQIEKELLKLPIIDKSSVKSNFDSIVNNSKNLRIKTVATSGTTGSGMKFPETRQMEQKQWAVWWRFRKWHGIEYGTWCGWFGGRIIIANNQNNHPYWRTNFPMKQIMFSAYHLKEETVNDYYKKLNHARLSWLHGYPSQIAEFAQLCKSKNLTSFPHLKIISTGAENLLEHQKYIIKEVFNVPVIQHYGLSEGVSNISQNKDGLCYPDQDFSYTEFVPLDESNPSKCRIVGTNYHNLAFPLIRYDTGDIAQIEWDSNSIPKIISIDGRREDYIELTDGRKLGRLDHIFKKLINIKKAQIYQKKDKKIIIYIIKGSKYDKQNEEIKLKFQLKLYFGGKENILIKYVDNIKNSASGKFRLVKSERA